MTPSKSTETTTISPQQDQEYHRSHSHSGEKRPYDPFKDSAIRYLGYVNEFGEAARQIIPRALVNATYVVAGAYGLADAVHKAYLAKYQPTESQRLQGETFSVFRAFTETSIFQCLASVFVPPFFVHLAVKGGQKLVKAQGIAPGSSKFKYIPILIGLSIIPLLPYTLDPLIEYGLDTTVHAGFNKWEISRLKERNLNIPAAIVKDMRELEEERQEVFSSIKQDKL